MARRHPSCELPDKEISVNQNTLYEMFPTTYKEGTDKAGETPKCPVDEDNLFSDTGTFHKGININPSEWFVLLLMTTGYSQVLQI